MTLLVLAASTSAAQQYSEWSTPINLARPVNSDGVDTDPFISKDGLRLYLVCTNCPGGHGDADIYVARRDRVTDPWGPPVNLGPTINTAAPEFDPVLSIDGHRLYFTSNRADGAGRNDIYVSRRHNKRDDLAWRAPVNLASINTIFNEGSPAPFEDDLTGEVVLYFASDQPGGIGDDDIWVSTLQPDETYGPAQWVRELSSPARDRHVNIRRDGLEIFFMSNRPGSVPNARGLPSFDFWVATRESTSDSWSEPVNLGPVVNSPFHDGHPALSFDGTTLYFFSGRPGNVSAAFDLWVTTRSKFQVLKED